MEKQVFNGRNIVKDFEKKTGLTLNNWGVLRTKEYKAVICSDVFRFLIEWQEVKDKTQTIYKVSIDYFEFAEQEIDITNLKDVIDYAIQKGDSDDYEENKDFELHLKEASENNFEIK